MRKQIKESIGFSDSELISYEKTNDGLIVFIEAWNGMRMKVTFFTCEGVLDIGAGDISDFIEETEPDDFFKGVISRVYDRPPEGNPYHLYQFLDSDDDPVLHVIASGVDIKEGE